MADSPRVRHPLFVYDADVLGGHVPHGGAAWLPGRADIFYSLKANPNISVCALLNSFGTGARSPPTPTLATALRAGVDPATLSSSPRQGREGAHRVASKPNIHAIVCESLDELDLLDSLLQRRT